MGQKFRAGVVSSMLLEVAWSMAASCRLRRMTVASEGSDSRPRIVSRTTPVRHCAVGTLHCSSRPVESCGEVGGAAPRAAESAIRGPGTLRIVGNFYTNITLRGSSDEVLPIL